MCGPMLGIIGGVFSAAGSIIGGMGQAAQYKAQQASLKAQAAFQRRQADAEMLKGSTDIALQRRGVERIVGGQRAGYAGGGIQVDTGTPVTVAEATETEAAIDRQAIRFGRDLRSTNEQYNAQISEMNAKAAGTASKYAMLSGFIGAGSALVSSFPTA